MLRIKRDCTKKKSFLRQSQEDTEYLRNIFSVLLPVGSSLVGGAFFAHSPKIRQVAFLFACQFPRKEDVTLRFASSAPCGV